MTRRRLAAVLGGTALVAAGAACTANGPPVAAGRSADIPGRPPGAQRDAAPMAFRLTPAAYQLPSGIAGEVVLPRGKDLVIMGGLTRRGTTASVTLLNPVTGRTARAGRLARPTNGAAGAVLGGREYVFGGAPPAAAAAVQAFGGQRVAAVTGRLPGPLSGLSSVTLGTTAYLIGGGGGAAAGAQVLATADGVHFRVAARLPVPVRDAGVAGTGRLIWVLGGHGRAGRTSVIQQVDVRTGRAAVVGHLPAPLSGAAAFTLGGRVFVAGGQTGGQTTGQAAAQAGRNPSGKAGRNVGGQAGRIADGQASPHAVGAASGAVLCYDPARRRVVRAGSLPVPVSGAAAAVLGGTAFLVGGTDGQRPVPAVVQMRLAAAGARGSQAAGTGLGSGVSLLDGTVPGRPGGTAPAGAPWLGPPHGRGHLAPGSDPSVLPGDVLIADNVNNRLLVVDPQGRVRWKFPRRGDLARGQRFLVPDDAFFTADGKRIVATEEDDSVISVIGVAQHKILYRYGTPGVPGAAGNHLSNPDDAMTMPDGRAISSDIKNCRVVLLPPPSSHRHRPSRVIGTTGGCWHDPPQAFGSPNGAFPTTSGDYIVTEITGDWADDLSLGGRVRWSVNPPGVAYPSDTNEVYPGRYLTADYSLAGQVVEFSSRGKLLWRFGGLNHPSLALPLPNGDILVNDDYNDRVIVIDPAAHRIVWQYGHTGVAGTGPGYLNDPDGVDLTPPGSMLITHAATMGLP